MLSVMRRLSYCFAAAFIACASFHVHADSFEQKLFSEVTSEELSGLFSLRMFPHELNKALGAIFPGEALDEKDYKHLVVELKKLSKRFDGAGYKAVLDDPQWRQQIATLTSRVLALSDGRLSGRCSKLGLDLESAKNSKGDWRQVKADANWDTARQAPGSEIKPSSNLHTKLYWYYRLGCDGKKDLETARKVLFDISDLAPKDASVRSELRSDIQHCTAEIWAKYGIGGPIDTVRAEEFSRRFTAAAYFVHRPDTPKLRAELTERFPDAAKNNFKCPKPHDSFRIDPRSPWNDLW